MENPNNTGAFIMDLCTPYAILKGDDNFFNMMGYQAADLNEKLNQLSKLVYPDDYEELINSLNYQLTRSNYTSNKVRLLKSNGKFYQILMNGQIFTLKDGRDVLKCTCTNITALEVASDVSEHELKDLEVFTKSVRCGLSKHLCDNSLTITWANDYFYKLFGYTQAEYSEIIGDSLTPMIFEEDLPLVVNCITNLAEDHEIEINFRTKHKSKPFRWMKLIASNLNDTETDGVPIVNFILTDVTRLKYAQIKAELETKKYEIISDISTEIPFEYEIDTDTITYAKKYDTYTEENVYGVIRSVNLSIPDLFQKIHLITFQEFLMLLRKGNPSIVQNTN